MMPRSHSLLTPLNLLMLVGLICQGYSWEHAAVPVVFAILWLLAGRTRRNAGTITADMEAFIVLVAFAVVKYVSSAYGIGYNKFIFLGGNVLAIYQLVRMVAGSNQRQKRMSVLAAVMHIGIGTQVLFDYKILIVLLAVVVLVPLSMRRLEAEGYDRSDDSGTPLWANKDLLWIGGVAVLFFLFFPRFSFRSGNTAAMMGLGGRGPLHRQLDAGEGGGGGSDQLIFRIEGRNIGNLRSFALDTFDGVTWSRSHWLKKMSRHWQGADEKNDQARSVKILNHELLGSSLPSDGHVKTLQGTFISRPIIAGDGSLQLTYPLRRNMSFVYWTTLAKNEEPLSSKERARYLTLPDRSPRLLAWANQITGVTTDPFTIASTIAAHLRTNFQYDLGAPDIERTNPVETFIFDERRGHCERFASALAVVLRLLNIPARVTLGYLPSEKNELGEFYNVRTKHAHAWTEAYIDGRGWTIFDATPLADGAQSDSKTFALTVTEWIEYVWYAKIIEFGVYEQQSVYRVFGTVSQRIRAYGPRILGTTTAVLAGIAMVWLLLKPWRTRILTFFNRRSRRRGMGATEAKHFYGQMLKWLARDNYFRRASHTPLEFVDVVARAQDPRLPEVRLITDSFCDIRYGGALLTAEQAAAVREALRRLKKRRRVT